MSPGAPHNVAGTLAAPPQTRRARLWTGGASGPSAVSSEAELLPLKEKVGISKFSRRTSLDFTDLR